MNQRAFVLRVIGILSITFSFSMLPPMAVSVWYNDGELSDFQVTFFTLFLTGLLLCIMSRNKVASLRRRDGVLIVASFWLYLSLVSTIPLMLGGHLGLVDSLFEATSGMTTTGATVIADLTRIEPSILYYRQQLQWIGGMGLIVLAIAVLPILGVGGAQLYRGETPGPMKDEKLTPRLSQTARNLWLIYVLITGSCAAGYWVAGMTPLEALEHSYSTVSTGGFSTHNESFAYFQSDAINIVAVIFMILGSFNFGVHFIAIRKRNPLLYLKDVEVRTFLLVVCFFVLLYTVFLYTSDTYQNIGQSFEYSLFEVTSVITSTGFGITDFTLWPLFMPVLLIFISFIGGCGGSTAGGIKVMRVLLMIKQGLHQFFVLLHPNAIRPVRVGNQILNENIIQAIWGFFSVYIFVFIILTLGMIMAGMDQVTAFSAVATCINNLGPGLGKVSANFAEVSDTAKVVGVMAMLMGRLEVFTLLVILMPEFWRN